jgi:hypothetical protein
MIIPAITPTGTTPRVSATTPRRIRSPLLIFDRTSRVSQIPVRGRRGEGGRAHSARSVPLLRRPKRVDGVSGGNGPPLRHRAVAQQDARAEQNEQEARDGVDRERFRQGLGIAREEYGDDGGQRECEDEATSQREWTRRNTRR